MALHEETATDHRFGRFMTHNLADYHVPTNADVQGIDVIFVEERDEEINQLGTKGVGEIGIVGTPAAIANAIYHATGKRIRDLPITIDKLMRSGEPALNVTTTCCEGLPPLPLPKITSARIRTIRQNRRPTIAIEQFLEHGRRIEGVIEWNRAAIDHQRG